MNLKKLGLGLVACTMLLTGCGDKKAENTSEVTGKEKLVVGMECNYAPFNWQTTEQTETSVSLGGAGFADGYDVRIARYLADQLDREVEIKKIAWDGLIPAINAGDIDVVIAGMTERKGLDFTDPYYDSEMVMIVRKDDKSLKKANSIQDFSGKSVVGQKNTNYDTIIDQIDGVKHAVPKNNYPEMVVALQKKEVDGITAEYPVAAGVVAANKDLSIVKFDKNKGFDIDTSVSVGMKTGSKDGELYNGIQKALKDLPQETRQQWMDEAVKNQPKVAE